MNIEAKNKTDWFRVYEPIPFNDETYLLNNTEEHIRIVEDWLWRMPEHVWSVVSDDSLGVKKIIPGFFPRKNTHGYFITSKPSLDKTKYINL